MRHIRLFIQPFYTCYVLLTFFISVCAVLPIFILLSSKDSHRWRVLMYKIVHHWSRFWLLIIGMKVTIKGEIPAHQNYVIVANHISYIDAIVIYATIGQYFRPLGKKEIIHVPLFGFIYKQMAILVDRSSDHSRAKSIRLLWRALKHDASILIFPEGTFNETDRPLKSFYDGAFKIAINSQTDILPILFPDTVDRWHYSAWWKFWPGKNRAYILPPIPTEKYTLDEVATLKQAVWTTMEQQLKQLAPTYPNSIAKRS